MPILGYNAGRLEQLRGDPMSTRTIAGVAQIRTKAGPAQPPKGTTDLASIIPTDVLAFYTGALALLIGTLGENPASDYLPLRWWLYGGGIAATLIAILIAYKTGDPNRVANDKRKWPLLEMIFAAIAFAFWGLVIPGSPLYVLQDTPTLAITTGILAAVGVFFVKAVFEPLLKRPVERS
jgi:uncharacterized membrane protein